MSDPISELPPLRDVLSENGLAPRKALGQNFLLDLNLTGRIARQALPLSGHTVLEVGPGPGGLTRALLAHGADRVVAIERDPRCVAALQPLVTAASGRLEVIDADALRFDVDSIVGAQPLKIVANLPYNIGTELLLRWLTVPQWPPRWESLTLMFQREVAERIVAPAGSSAYGRLAVLAGWRTQARILFDVSRDAFTPPPQVTSSIVHLVPRSEPLPVDIHRLETVTRAAFGQRRKMLRQSLKGLGGEALLNAAGIDPTRRAETIGIEEFLKLANIYEQWRP